MGYEGELWPFHNEGHTTLGLKPPNKGQWHWQILRLNPIPLTSSRLRSRSIMPYEFADRCHDSAVLKREKARLWSTDFEGFHLLSLSDTCTLKMAHKLYWCTVECASARSTSVKEVDASAAVWTEDRGFNVRVEGACRIQTHSVAHTATEYFSGKSAPLFTAEHLYLCAAVSICS